jgi:hypothetical protein
MFIPIPIPIGVKRVVAVQGAVWKFVSCAQCHEDFAYLLQLEAVGEDHDLLFLDAEDSTKRAQAHAEHNLSEQSRNVVAPVPCPSCGFYQADMVRRLKEEGTSDRAFKIGMGVAVLSFVPPGVPDSSRVDRYGNWGVSRSVPDGVRRPLRCPL